MIIRHYLLSDQFEPERNNQSRAEKETKQFLTIIRPSQVNEILLHFSQKDYPSPDTQLIYTVVKAQFTKAVYEMSILS
jgi:hypothetical protein